MSQDEKILEIAKTGYETSIQLWTYEGNNIWDKFNAMLVANSIAIAGIIQVDSLCIQLILGFFGALLCWFWRLFLKRGFEALDYWILSAKELEANHFSPTVFNIQRGGEYFEGQEVQFTIGSNVIRKKNLYSKKIRKVTYYIIDAFISTYIVLVLIYIVKSLLEYKVISDFVFLNFNISIKLLLNFFDIEGL